jgi:hypothetical protein
VAILRQGCPINLRTDECGFLHKRFVSIRGPLLAPVLKNLQLTECDYCAVADTVKLNRSMKESPGSCAKDPKCRYCRLRR